MKTDMEYTLTATLENRVIDVRQDGYKVKIVYDLTEDEIINCMVFVEDAFNISEYNLQVAKELITEDIDVFVNYITHRSIGQRIKLNNN